MFKAFDRGELISSNELKEISKKKLFDEMLAVCKKLGLIHNNELRAVILDIKTYEKLIHRLDELENLHEDLELVEEFKERVQLSADEWIKKPADVSRIRFLRQTMKEKSNPS
ncbi:hypothetical protein [Lihuaxuella thermophila]|uniref:Uncharacterized protein n=1 Tax=Lihuaxuella thermophila TaxID=1173111 RepID=A0A1H8HIV4_9BACL|nr:hypothetical protein [Lihuaxuella thermophila]SEN55979.1 hypothetical protein SAMN05444955_11447 [Lihuaxuella thermophila]